MSTKFLILILDWLQEQFIKNADAAKQKATDYQDRIRALELQRKEFLREASLADKLAGKIDNLLSE
jgi:hypothetical protein